MSFSICINPFPHTHSWPTNFLQFDIESSAIATSTRCSLRCCVGGWCVFYLPFVLGSSLFTLLLDVSKAFHCVWHEGLIFKLENSPLPRAAIHIRSYLFNRPFRMFVGGKTSTPRPARTGFSQVRVLHSLYTNVRRPCFTMPCSYVLHKSTQTARTFQWQVDAAVSSWLKLWWVKVDVKKQLFCCKRRRRMPRAPLPAVLLDDEPITWKTSVK